jgi:hypothetical protein
MPPCWISAAVCSQAVHVPTTGADPGLIALLIVAGVLLVLGFAVLLVAVKAPHG